MIYTGNYATTKTNDLVRAKSCIRQLVTTPDGVLPKVGSNCMGNSLWLPCDCPGWGFHLGWIQNVPPILRDCAEQGCHLRLGSIVFAALSGYSGWGHHIVFKFHRSISDPCVQCPLWNPTMTNSNDTQGYRNCPTFAGSRKLE
jgi:hypothetical protein